jgi:DNA invertase Pin-like site-specific DNA recombinase
MRKIGYARVSTNGQNLDRQIAALRSEGVDEIYREKASGKSLKGRPQLEKAIDALGVGDVLVVAEWDRVTRSFLDGADLIMRLHDRGALLKVLDKAALDLTTALGQALMGLFSAIAEDKRKRIVKRAQEGREAARKRGDTKFGRKPKLRPEQVAHAKELRASGASAREIGRKLGVSHSTISRLA